MLAGSSWGEIDGPCLGQGPTMGYLNEPHVKWVLPGSPMKGEELLAKGNQHMSHFSALLWCSS